MGLVGWAGMGWVGGGLRWDGLRWDGLGGGLRWDGLGWAVGQSEKGASSAGLTIVHVIVYYCLTSLLMAVYHAQSFDSYSL